MVRGVRLVAAAGTADGRGHLARALALAEALAAAGRDGATGTDLELELVRGEPTPFEHRRVARAGARLVEAGSPLGDGVVVVLDVPDVTEIAARFGPDGLMVFDDRDAFGGAAGIVVQPSLDRWSGPGTAGRVLAGYRYAPVADAVRRLRSSRAGAAPRADGRRVFVCFGGSDPARVTERVVPALAAVPGIELDVVVGAGYAGRLNAGAVEAQRDPPDVAERMAAADLVVCGAGTMKFEAACLGRPALLLAVADDQLPVGPAFARSGAAEYLGDGRTVDPGTVAAATGALLDDPARRARLGAAGARVVDGAGADRVAKAALDLAA